MNGEQQRNCKDTAVAYYKVLQQQSLVETEENYENRRPGQPLNPICSVFYVTASLNKPRLSESPDYMVQRLPWAAANENPTVLYSDPVLCQLNLLWTNHILFV
jgi:hypothetical protein